jgi:ribosome biogenesis protein ENP2
MNSKNSKNTMNVQKRNGVSIYCLSTGAAIPEWLGDRARRNLSKTNESVRRRVELIQDFAMPASSSKLVASADGRYIVAAGTYPPRIRCYDVHELAMKFERYVNAEIVDIVLLGDDYGKLALLLADRTVAFHAHYGAHESIRIPTFGRAMTYEPSTCELLVAAQGTHVYRINLEEGRCSAPWDFAAAGPGDASSSGTCIAVHPRHPLLALGCDQGAVRFWDSRSADTSRRPFLQLDVTAGLTSLGYAWDASRPDDAFRTSTAREIAAIAYDPSGLHMAVGTGHGLVALYDIRSSRPLCVQEHKHGSAIHTVRFHASSGMVLSADEQLIKVWRYKPSDDIHFSIPSPAEGNEPSGVGLTTDATQLGSVMVNIEGTGKLTNFIIAGDEKDPSGERSGLLLCATDQPKMDSFYVPALGVAPKWCSYLDNITEELEERDLKRDGSGINTDDLLQSGQETVFENYKFVTRDDLEKLGISNLIGTPMLRGYMHGFFIDVKLYNRVRAVANPFEYEEYQKKKLKERLDAKQASRIAPRVSKKKNKKDKVAVNPDLADRLASKATAESTKAGKVAKGLLSDNRFGGLFTNPDFEIDQDNEDFRLRNPSGLSAKNKRNNLDSDSENDDESMEEANPDKGEGDSEDMELVDPSDDEHDDNSSDNDSQSDSDEDGFRGGKVRGEAYKDMKRLERKLEVQNRNVRNHAGSKKPVLQEEDNLGLSFGDGSAQNQAQRRREEMSMPLAKRKALESEQSKQQLQTRTHSGSREVVYYPKSSGRKSKFGKSGRK